MYITKSIDKTNNHEKIIKTYKDHTFENALMKCCSVKIENKFVLNNKWYYFVKLRTNNGYAVYIMHTIDGKPTLKFIDRMSCAIKEYTNEEIKEIYSLWINVELFK